MCTDVSEEQAVTITMFDKKKKVAS